MRFYFNVSDNITGNRPEHVFILWCGKIIVDRNHFFQVPINKY